jgi:hypothetical protein
VGTFRKSPRENNLNKEPSSFWSGSSRITLASSYNDILSNKKIDTALAVFNRTLIGDSKPPELTAGCQAAHATLSQENTSSGLTQRKIKWKKNHEWANPPVWRSDRLGGLLMKNTEQAMVQTNTSLWTDQKQIDQASRWTLLSECGQQVALGRLTMQQAGGKTLELWTRLRTIGERTSKEQTNINSAEQKRWTLGLSGDPNTKRWNLAAAN